MGIQLEVKGSHLLVCDRDKSLLGQLPQSGQVSPHVQLTANQHHLGIGAKLLSLSLPLVGGGKQSYGGVEGDTGRSFAPRTQKSLILLALSA